MMVGRKKYTRLACVAVVLYSTTLKISIILIIHPNDRILSNT